MDGGSRGKLGHASHHVQCKVILVIILRVCGVAGGRGYEISRSQGVLQSDAIHHMVRQAGCQSTHWGAWKGGGGWTCGKWHADQHVQH